MRHLEFESLGRCLDSNISKYNSGGYLDLRAEFSEAPEQRFMSTRRVLFLYGRNMYTRPSEMAAPRCMLRGWDLDLDTCSRYISHRQGSS